ncbi:putative ABC transport system permease protein [Larkinella arboricola]|uniref:Putative ABC transport system permease protein n=1 Tax=Larkinella arboricola TaxID=643671 RepID=A0A327X7T5_LARAB|nr:ABC transporter permease [Larkinella arboricola]RAK02791.1 putative ABC transport system permease protein [Larkinella arboricola]
MLRNYFKIAFRNLRRNPVFTGINVVGLAVGLASCLLLYIYISHELSYDNFHPNADRIVRVVMEYSMEGQVNRVQQTGTKVAPEFSRRFPEVELGVRLENRPAVVSYADRKFLEKRVVYADSTLFAIFSFPLKVGNPKTALAGPNKTVLSESTARKYFGNQNPVGKTVRINTGWGDQDYTVTGIVGDSPANSQIKYDVLASFSTLSASKIEQWFSANYATYLLLRKPESIASLQVKIPGFMKTQFGPGQMSAGNYLTYLLEPLRSVHLYSDTEGSFEPNGDRLYIYIFGSVAVLILIIACVNYINLATSRAVERAQEVGVRKVMGALRRQLFGQFMGESVLVTFTALALSLLMVYLTLPLFNELSDRQFSFEMLMQPGHLLGLLGIGLLVSLVAGGYPALVLARFEPVRALTGHLKVAGAGQFRRALIVFQFAVTAFLIVCTLLVRNQLAFIQDKKLGYDKEHVLVLPADGQVNEKIRALKSEFKQHADVQQVARAYESPTFIEGGYSMRRSDKAENQYKSVTALPVDEDFAKTMNLRIVAGRDLTAGDLERATVPGSDSLRHFHFILNESAVKELGWKSPREAIGQKMDMGNGRPGVVGAVVEDFHFASMKQKITPLVLFPEDGGNVVLVKLSGSRLPHTLQFLEQKWKTIVPSLPFAYEFLDEEFNRLYSLETRTGQIFSVFAFLSILLACLGLFGLSAYTTAQRTKEIGVRKVLGASVSNIVLLLSKDFLKLVLIAIVLASPVAWWAMNRWLEGFAYRIDVAWWVFLVAALLAVGIAFLTVSFQSVKAALMNPVKSLKTE